MLQTILSISGKPGLFKLVSRGKNNLVVETLDSARRRMPVFASDRVTSLADIAMFTNEEDVPLADVLGKVRDKEQGKVCSLNWRKASGTELFSYFGEVLPTFDRDRVIKRHQEAASVVRPARRQWHQRLRGVDEAHRGRQC